MKTILPKMRSILGNLLLIITCILAFSCHSIKNTTTNNEVMQVPASFNGQHPDYYTGIIPCADCPGIRMDLFLGTGISPKGGHFELSETYLERDVKPFKSKGNWAFITLAEDPGTKVVILNSDREKSKQRYFLQLKNGNLLILDTEMKKIESNLNFTLELQGKQD